MLIIVKGWLSPILFIMELCVVTVLPSSCNPSKEHVEDAKEGPPETHSESPNHTQEFIIELVHHSSRYDWSSKVSSQVEEELTHWRRCCLVLPTCSVDDDSCCDWDHCCSEEKQTPEQGHDVDQTVKEPNWSSEHKCNSPESHTYLDCIDHILTLVPSILVW